MITKTTTTDNGTAYLVSNNEVDLLAHVSGADIMSGKIVTSPDQVATLLKLMSEAGQSAGKREFEGEWTKQRGGKNIDWLRVEHGDFIDMMGEMPAISSPYTRMYFKYVYLADEDADNYVNALKAAELKLFESKDKEIVVNSQILKLQPFSVDDLAVAYYEGREFWARKSKDRAEIININRTGQKNVTFYQTINGEDLKATVTLITFSDRYTSVDPANKNAENVDLHRYAITAERKITPEIDDAEYFDSIKEYVGKVKANESYKEIAKDSETRMRAAFN